MKTRLLTMGFDDNYLFPALVTLFSARKSFDGSLRLLIAHDGESLSPKSIALLEDACSSMKISVSFMRIRIPAALKGFGHLSRMSWARIILMTSLDEEFLWLDADLILGEGWSHLLDSQKLESPEGIGAALDPNPAPEGSRNAAYAVAGSSYINDGVLLVDPSRISQDFLQLVELAIADYAQLGLEWLDQDVINYSLRGRGEVFSQEFNTQVPIKRLGPTNGKILHFTSDAKPWLGPFRLIYFWSFSVRHWNRNARLLIKSLNTDPLLQGSIRRLRKKTFQGQNLNWRNGDSLKRFLLFSSRLIWRVPADSSKKQ